MHDSYKFFQFRHLKEPFDISDRRQSSRFAWLLLTICYDNKQTIFCYLQNS